MKRASWALVEGLKLLVDEVRQVLSRPGWVIVLFIFAVLILLSQLLVR